MSKKEIIKWKEYEIECFTILSLKDEKIHIGDRHTLIRECREAVQLLIDEEFEPFTFTITKIVITEYLYAEIWIAEFKKDKEYKDNNIKFYYDLNNPDYYISEKINTLLVNYNNYDTGECK